jgi:hypothetical protein
VHRRTLTLLLPLTLAVIATGCGTFSDNNAIARVDDTELTQDDFEQQLLDHGITDQDVVQLEPARAEITRWIQSELVDEDQIAALYNVGPGTSGVACLQAIVVQDSAAADETVSELAGGTSFEAVFDAANIDPSIAGDLGTLPCIPPEGLESSDGVPLIDATLQLSATEIYATAPLIGEIGQEVAYAVIVFRPYEDLGVEDVEIVAASIDVSSQLADADVYVDPRYGTFDATTGQVIALG